MSLPSTEDLAVPKQASAGVHAARRSSPIDNIVGHRVRIFRTAKGLSQTALGTAIGVTFQQVQKYEKGVNRIGSGRLSQIAAILEVPVTEFFEESPKRSQGAKNKTLVTDLLAEPYAVEMLQAFSKLSRKDIRRAFVHLIEKAVAHSEG
jgi:transcriptional regulator with XRE-family HTH domain